MTKEIKICKCGKNYTRLGQHSKSVFHKNWEKNENKTEAEEDEKTDETDCGSKDDETLDENNEEENSEFELEEDDNFLEDLQTDNYISEETYLERDLLLEKQNQQEFLAKKRELQLEKEQVKIEKLRQKPAVKPKAIKEVQSSQDDGEIFSERPTELLGEKKLILLKKIKTYKHLFQEIPEVKKFKIKKNPNEQDLIDAINEIDAIINTNSIDAFISDALFESIAVCEGISKIYVKKYDISGLSQALKSNPQFLSVLKQLYLRYNTFSAIPPEYQAVMIISTTAFLVIQKNKQDRAIDLLNEKIIV